MFRVAHFYSEDESSMFLRNVATHRPGLQSCKTQKSKIWIFIALKTWNFIQAKNILTGYVISLSMKALPNVIAQAQANGNVTAKYLTNAISRVIFEKPIVTQLTEKSPSFMQPEIHCRIHKKHLLIPADESSPHTITQFFNIEFIILLFKPRYSKWYVPFRGTE
jgi:hypothetical protein